MRCLVHIYNYVVFWCCLFLFYCSFFFFFCNSLVMYLWQPWPNYTFQSLAIFLKDVFFVASGIHKDCCFTMFHQERFIQFMKCLWKWFVGNLTHTVDFCGYFNVCMMQLLHADQLRWLITVIRLGRESIKYMANSEKNYSHSRRTLSPTNHIDMCAASLSHCIGVWEHVCVSTLGGGAFAQ